MIFNFCLITQLLPSLPSQGKRKAPHYHDNGSEGSKGNKNLRSLSFKDPQRYLKNITKLKLPLPAI